MNITNFIYVSISIAGTLERRTLFGNADSRHDLHKIQSQYWRTPQSECLSSIHNDLKKWKLQIRGYIRQFPDWVDNEINNNKHSLRSNTKGYGGKIHYSDSQNSDTTTESCTTCSSRSRGPVRKLLDTPSYIEFKGRPSKSISSQTGNLMPVPASKSFLHCLLVLPLTYLLVGLYNFMLSLATFLHPSIYMAFLCFAVSRNLFNCVITLFSHISISFFVYHCKGFLNLKFLPFLCFLISLLYFTDILYTFKFGTPVNYFTKVYKGVSKSFRTESITK
jgi:hypothetical protein